MKKEPKIEKGIPIPQRGNGNVALFKKLNIGDSVLIDDKKNWNNYHNTARQAGIRVTSRKEGTSRRVWRIE